jgi:predicted ATPase
LGSRAHDLLHLLVTRAGEVIGRDELIAFAWPTTIVHDSNLKVTIAALRRVLSEDPTEPSFIATVPGRGYRFVVPVRMIDGARDGDPIDFVKLHPTALPQTSEVVGRDSTLADLEDALGATGLVTVTGPAGVGKTAVAVAVGRLLAANYKDGVAFVDLAAVSDPQLVAGAIAVSLGIGSNVTNMLAGLVDALRDREVLLVIDNCEHVLVAVAMVADHLLAALPNLKILATSREQLRLPAESVYRLSALACPAAGAAPDAQAALAFPAIELLVLRASASGYRFGDADAPIVGAICRRLEGNALAIELAAPRLAASGASELFEMLQRSYASLHARPGTVHFRHQTLLATLDWSYRLLSTDEAALLRLLSVFVGPFALDDAIKVSGGLGRSAEDVAATIGSLTAKSLLSMAFDAGSPRYRLLDSTRAFAGQRLQAAGEQHAALARYARHLLGVFEQAEGEWRWRAREDWTACYAPLANDLRKAIEWAFGANGDPVLGVRLTTAAIPLWDELSTIQECLTRVERALESIRLLPSRDLRLEMKLVAAQASALNFSASLDREVDDAWHEGYRLACATGDVDYQLRTLWGRAVLQSFSGHHVPALATLGRFETTAMAGQDGSALPDGERLRLMTSFYCGDIRSALAGLEPLAQERLPAAAGVRMARFQIDRHVGVRVSLAWVSWIVGDHGVAHAMAEEALARASSLDHLVSRSNALAQAALPIALQAGLVDRARGHLTALTHSLDLQEIPIWQPVRRFFLGALAAAAGDEVGLEAMHEAVDELVANNFLVRVPMYASMAAEAALLAGDVDRANSSLDVAFEHADRQTEHWYRPEQLRIRGALQDRAGDRTAAERSLEYAISAAEESGARLFQLRSTTQLAELLASTGRRHAAARLLAPIAGQFRDEPGGTDVLRARIVLESLLDGASVRRHAR